MLDTPAIVRAEHAGRVINMARLRAYESGGGRAGHGSSRTHGEGDQSRSSRAHESSSGRSSHSSSRGPSSQSSSGTHGMGGKIASGGEYASSTAPSRGIMLSSGGEQISSLMLGLGTDKLSNKHGRSRMPASGAREASSTQYPTSKKRDERMKQDASGKLASSSGHCTSASDGYQANGAHYGSGNGGSRQGDDGSDYGGRGVRHTSATGRGQDDLGLSRMTLRGLSPNRGPSSGQSTYELYLTVYGRGLDPKNRLHWAFMVCRCGDDFGDRHHVTLINREALLYMYEVREGSLLESEQCEGRCLLAVWNAEQRQQEIQAMQDEPPPRDGRRRCQDWTSRFCFHSRLKSWSLMVFLRGGRD